MPGSDRSTKKIRLWSKTDAIDKAMRHLGLFEKGNRQQGRTWRSRSSFGSSGARADRGEAGAGRHAFSSASRPCRRRGIGAKWRTVAGGASRDDDHVTVDVAKLWPRTVLALCDANRLCTARDAPYPRGAGERRDSVTMGAGERRCVQFHAPRRQPRHTWGSP